MLPWSISINPSIHLDSHDGMDGPHSIHRILMMLERWKHELGRQLGVLMFPDLQYIFKAILNHMQYSTCCCFSGFRCFWNYNNHNNHNIHSRFAPVQATDGMTWLQLISWLKSAEILKSPEIYSEPVIKPMGKWENIGKPIGKWRFTLWSTNITMERSTMFNG